MSPSTIWNRINRPFSRFRHNRLDSATARAFVKQPMAAQPAQGDVCIIGALSAKNGLSRAARYELDRLKAIFPQADITDVRLDPRGALPAYAARRGGKPPAMAIFLMPPNAIWRYLRTLSPAFLAGTYRISLAVWELPYFPKQWSFIDEFFHEFWTPTAFSALALQDGAHRRVTVVPHYVTLPDEQSDPAPPLRDGVLRGLSIMDLSTCPDRKNPWAHIEAWQKAFGDADHAVLTMKLRFSRRTAAIRRELQAMIGDSRNIRIVEQEYTDEEVLQLQQASDLCLSLHRAEGFGLTICEMLELGKAAVATGWSGNVEFMDRFPNAHAVKYKLVPYRDYLNRYPGYDGDWAEADTDDAAHWLRVVASELMSRDNHPKPARAAATSA